MRNASISIRKSSRSFSDGGDVIGNSTAKDVRILPDYCAVSEILTLASSIELIDI